MRTLYENVSTVVIPIVTLLFKGSKLYYETLEISNEVGLEL